MTIEHIMTALFRTTVNTLGMSLALATTAKELTRIRAEARTCIALRPLTPTYAEELMVSTDQLHTIIAECGKRITAIAKEHTADCRCGTCSIAWEAKFKQHAEEQHAEQAALLTFYEANDIY